MGKVVRTLIKHGQYPDSVSLMFGSSHNFQTEGVTRCNTVLNFRGTTLGIAVRKVMEIGTLPQVNTGIAHKDPGVDIVGAGILRGLEKCFKDGF